MSSIDNTLQQPGATGALARLNDDLCIEADLAALYLGLSPKALDDFRVSDEGPRVFEPTVKGAGRPQRTSYLLGALRAWRAAHPIGRELDIAKHRGLAGWVIGVEPFWMNRAGLVIGAALDREESHWDECFMRALTGELRVEWMTPRDALGRRWKRVESHSELVYQYNAVLDAERFAAFAALETTEIASEVASAVASH